MLHFAGNENWEQYLVGLNDKYMDSLSLWPAEEKLPGFRQSLALQLASLSS